MELDGGENHRRRHRKFI